MTDLGLTSTQEFWLEHVEACAEAGVSMKSYAERHSLNLQSFYGWKGQLKKRRLVSPPPSSRDANAMMSVAVVASPGPGVVAGPSARISLANGVTIEVPSGVSPQALVRLIDAAMDMRCAGQDASRS